LGKDKPKNSWGKTKMVLKKQAVMGGEYFWLFETSKRVKS
jgi:hypothetical protein